VGLHWSFLRSLRRRVTDVMTMETLASFHVFISFNLHIFHNHLVTCRISTCLTICHISKVVPRRRYNKGYFFYTLKECKSQHFLHYKFWRVITRKSFRPEPSFRPKAISIGYIVTQALVSFFLSWFTINPTAALHEVTPADSTTMNVLFVSLTLFGGKSG